MSDSLRKPMATSCEECGAKFSDRPWTPGEPCPECGSDRFAPVTVRHTGSDYDNADRSAAFALEDIRFGRMAQWAEFVSAKQVQAALHEQKNMAGGGRKVPDIASIFVRDKLLNKQQVAAIHLARKSGGAKDDKDFATAAVKMGAVIPDKIDQCMKIQAELKQEGREIPPLPLLLYEKRFMTEQHILAILKGGEIQNWGMLHVIKANSVKEPGALSVSASSGGNRKFLLAGIIIILLFILLWSGHVITGGAAMAAVQCTKCHAVFAAPEDSVWPIACPKCKLEACCYPMAICLDCGERYARTSFGGEGVSCPRCHSTRYVMLTSKTDTAKIDSEVKAAKNKKPVTGAETPLPNAFNRRLEP